MVEGWADRVAYVFNRTALGVGVLLGGYAILQGWWVRAAVVFLVLVPLYFYLHDRFDAP